MNSARISSALAMDRSLLQMQTPDDVHSFLRHLDVAIPTLMSIPL